MAISKNEIGNTNTTRLTRKALHFAAKFCLLLFTVTASTSYAQSAAQNCVQTLKKLTMDLQQAQSQFSTCRSAKLNELENFSAKRSRYRRIMAWAEQLQFAESLQPYINALAERDLLLTSKFDYFESCVPPLRDIPMAQTSSQGDDMCTKTLASTKNELADMAHDLRTCHSCSLAKISEGYDKSALEILILQQKDARMLREALYQQLLDNEVGILSTANQWQITRDVFLAYVTDTAIQLPNTQPLIVMLEHLEKALESVDTPGDNTNKVMDVYQQLANTLQGDPKNRHQSAVQLWELYNGVVSRHPVTPATVRFTGFKDENEIAQLVNTMPAHNRQTLRSVIATALARYQSINTSS